MITAMLNKDRQFKRWVQFQPMSQCVTLAQIGCILWVMCAYVHVSFITIQPWGMADVICITERWEQKMDNMLSFSVCAVRWTATLLSFHLSFFLSLSDCFMKCIFCLRIYTVWTTLSTVCDINTIQPDPTLDSTWFILHLRISTVTLYNTEQWWYGHIFFIICLRLSIMWCYYFVHPIHT